MKLHIHGIGTLALGLDEPFHQGTGQLENVPIRDYIKGTVGRRFGRLSKITFVASLRAIADAGVEDPGSLAVVSSTCIGETKSSISLAEQIHRTRGALVSPSLIPNSVHNAAAGYLSIAIENRSPSVTVSQGWLSPEACLSAAADLLYSGASERAIVVCGDEADPGWAEKLRGAGASLLASRLDDEQYQEGAIALVVGEEPGGRSLGTVTAAVERCEPTPRNIAALLDKYGIHIESDASVRVRINAGGGALANSAASALNRSADRIVLDGPGPGTAQVAALIALAKAIEDEDTGELLLLGSELDELAFLHWNG